MQLLNEIPVLHDHINKFLLHITGMAAAGISYAPIEYQVNWLITNGIGTIPFSVWLQIIGGVYVVCLIILVFPKIIKQLSKCFMYVYRLLNKAFRFFIKIKNGSK